ncbi:MAG: hypothetical protein LC799_11765, partial [Actinobacteria bacterium]|nr:hypothetical protein [Actinomycetota bacterium]
YADALAGGVPEVVTDLPTAELVKAAANSFLATKISFVNAMAEVCDAAARLSPELTHASTVAGACMNADLVLLATEWPQYVELDPAHLAGMVRGRRVGDTRHALDAGCWRAAGWRYRAPGRVP